MATEIFKRVEQKYVINQMQYDLLNTLMNQHMVADAYLANRKPYTICNLYYDTADSALIRTSLEHPVYKEKLRLRSYGIPAANDVVFLEIKKKVAGVVSKRRTGILLHEAEAFLQNGALPVQSALNRQVFNEIMGVRARFDLMPALFLAYDRIAYLGRDDASLRVTFDKNIRARRDRLSLSEGAGGDPLLQPGRYIMEIKTAKAIPLWLAHALSKGGIRRVSFSKYGAVYQRGLIQNSLSGPPISTCPAIENKKETLPCWSSFLAQ